MPKKTFFRLPPEKQQRILNAAAEEFIEYKDHYKKSSVNRIADRAGIAVGSIYKYFYDKDDLLLYLFSVNKKDSESSSESDTFYSYSNNSTLQEDFLTPTGEILSEIIFTNTELFHNLIFKTNVEDAYMEQLNTYLACDQNNGLAREEINKDIAVYMYTSLEYIAYQYCQQNGIDFTKNTSVLKELTDLFFFGLYKNDEEQSR